MSRIERWQRVRKAIGFADGNAEAAERCERNGTPSKLRENDVRRALEQALAELNTASVTTEGV